MLLTLKTSLIRSMLGVVTGLGVSGVAAAQDAVPANPEPQAEAQPTEEPVEMPDTVYMLMKTNQGEIYLALNHEKAPISVENFVDYAEAETYNGTVFHRVIPTFMIQGGGFEPDGVKRETKAGIKNEWKNGLSNTRGSIAMARLGNRPDSGTNQFFINVSDNAFLDQPRDGAGYAVFGEVVKGLDIVDKIKAVQTGTKETPNGGMGDWPIENVVIEVVRQLTDEEVEKLVAELEGAGSEG
ncbi:MAG: cyclophilin family peptidyl-prolyl cis-trans isomerase [Phycisphaerales bacterium]|jgi:cyclophilin family peptidyl-prolyl cis-trans isomerase